MNQVNERFNTDRLRAVSITEAARRLGCNLRRVGVTHVALCPWHDDHHPSLSLVEGTGKNYCHCFSCGKGGDVISFAMQSQNWTFQEACQWLSGEFGILPIQGVQPIPRQQVHRVEQVAPPAYTYIPTEMLDRLMSLENSFCKCLMHLFQPEAVEWVAEEYRLATYAMNGLDDYTVFPNIDRHGRICNLKIQHYDTDYPNPRFAHSDQTAYWLGKMWAREGLLPRNAEFCSDCLFGEHLLPSYPQTVVALVESPKNAVCGALAFPKLLWLATGSKGMLKRQVLEPLKGRDVIIIPDCDAVDEWIDTVSGMADLANFTISDFCRSHAPEGQPKYDIADYIIEQRMPF